MSDYKRWVSYIYSYDENVKKNNSGYIRVETRGMITRLMVHINTSDETGRLLAYVFVREDSVMKGVLLGSIDVDKNGAQGSFEINSYDIMGSGFKMTEAGGMVVINEVQAEESARALSFYASEWDDSPIDITDFREDMIKAASKKSEYLTEDDAVEMAENITDEVSVVEMATDTIKDISAMEMEEDITDEVSVVEMATDTIKDISAMEMEEDITDEVSVVEMATDIMKDIPVVENAQTAEKSDEDYNEECKEVFKKAPKEVFKGLSKEVSNGVPKEVPWEGPKDVSGEVPWEGPKDVSGEVPKDVPWEVSKDVSREGPKDVSREVFMGLSKEISEDMSAAETRKDTAEDEVAVTECIKRHPLKTRAADLEKIENVLKTYPYMYPFEDDSVDVCVRLEPGDIDKLPVDTWLLANNSFLLNGYYSYRHIILMKMNSDSKPVYLVGVPGIHRQREDFLAGMFGFKMFKPIRDVSTVKGEFGYWCMNICP